MKPRMTIADVDIQPERERQAYYSVAAQEDNLGDVIIRKTVLHWIAQCTNDLHVYRGNMSNDYMAAMEIPPEATVHESSSAFTNALLGACAKRHAALVFAPGPRVAAKSMSSRRSASQMTFMAALTRSSGGPVLGVGGALGGQTSLALTLHRRTASICSDYSVRDSQSQKLLGFDRFGVNRARLIPDVAFAAANPQSGDIAEPVLTISLRCDRSPDMWRLAAVSSAAAANGVQPVIVTQVRRDQAQHERLASELGIEVCGWYDQTHAEQLRRIDKYYRRSVAVYSDRLHACILGARYGAKILNAEGASASKIRVTLSKLLEHPSGVVPRQYADVEDSEFSSERDARTIEMVRTAVATLESERRYLASGLRGQQVASTVRT